MPKPDLECKRSIDLQLITTNGPSAILSMLKTLSYDLFLPDGSLTTGSRTLNVRFLLCGIITANLVAVSWHLIAKITSAANRQIIIPGARESIFVSVLQFSPVIIICLVFL